MRAEFGPAASPAELSLANASKVIPLVTSSHLPAAAGMTFWPEIYTNMPVADEKQRHIYGDTPSPKVFGHVSPLDPGLFMSAAEYFAELTGSPRSGRCNPADVARWLDAFAAAAEEQIRSALTAAGGANSPALRRLEIDVRAQLGLGKFFAAKIRSAVAWTFYQADNKPENLRDALSYARTARDAWKGIVSVTKGAYLEDITFGELPHQRGSWADRLPSIEQDVLFLKKLLGESAAGAVTRAPAWLDPRRNPPPCHHMPPASFTPGKPLAVHLSTPGTGLAMVRIHCRHVTHAERFIASPMSASAGDWRFEIGGNYTSSPYALQYYFQLGAEDGTNWLYP